MVTTIRPLPDAGTGRPLQLLRVLFPVFFEGMKLDIVFSVIRAQHQIKIVAFMTSPVHLAANCPYIDNTGQVFP